MDSASAQERVRKYWDGRPCDSDLSDLPRMSREYFLDIERQRYELQPHILEILSKFDWRGKRVLEIGSGGGEGRDSRVDVMCKLFLATFSLSLASLAYATDGNAGRTAASAGAFSMDCVCAEYRAGAGSSYIAKRRS